MAIILIYWYNYYKLPYSFEKDIHSYSCKGIYVTQRELELGSTSFNPKPLSIKPHANPKLQHFVFSIEIPSRYCSDYTLLNLRHLPRRSFEMVNKCWQNGYSFIVNNLHADFLIMTCGFCQTKLYFQRKTIASS